MERGSAPPMELPTGQYKQAMQDLPPSYEQSIGGGFIPPESFPPQPLNYHAPLQNYPPATQSYLQLPQNYPPPPQNQPPPPLSYRAPPQNYPPPPLNYPAQPLNYQPPLQNYPPPPQNYQQPSQSYTPPVQQLDIQTVQPPSFGHRPVTMTCPHCQNHVTTSIESEPSALAWIAGGVLCFVGLWCCACFPFCIDSLKSVTHKCPSCKKVLGKQKGYSSSPPHIVFILADDIGYNDVGYHNQNIKTPNIDYLAKEGLILEQHYAQFQCTPSRSALMTARYPYKYGRQRAVLRATQPTGLTLEYSLLPGYLQDSGYTTRLVGKWHLGFCHPAYLPTTRGFLSHYGYWNAEEDYYTKRALDWNSIYGYDFHEDLEITREPAGIYSTYVYKERVETILRNHSIEDKDSPLFLLLATQSAHSPLEAPEHYVDMYGDISDHNRRVYSAMVTALDDLVGNVTKSLVDAGMYNNSIIIFVSDNGGATTQGGNNFPLRGEKATLFEGGMRVPAFIHSPLFSFSSKISDQLMHITDWLPTLMSAAGLHNPQFELVKDDLDGVDLWEALTTGGPSPRREIVHNIDDVKDGGEPIAALRVGDWKLVQRPNGNSDWIEVPDRNNMELHDDDWAPLEDNKDPRPAPPPPVPTNHTYLFNVNEDPEERVDLSEEFPDKVNEMVERIRELTKDLVDPDNPDTVWEGHPANFGWEWSTGWCNVSSEPTY